MPNIWEQFVKDFAEYYHNWLTNLERSEHDIDYWLDIFKAKEDENERNRERKFQKWLEALRNNHL